MTISFLQGDYKVPIPRHVIGMSSVSHRYLIGVSSVSHRYLIGISSANHRYLIGISSVSHWHIIGISSVSHRYLIGISSVSHRYLRYLNIDPDRGIIARHLGAQTLLLGFSCWDKIVLFYFVSCYLVWWVPVPSFWRCPVETRTQTLGVGE